MGADIAESGTGTVAGNTNIRRARLEDFPAILRISNWALQHTAANLRIEPETLDHWIAL